MIAKPQLVEDWARVLRRSWAVWLAVASAIAGVVELNHADLAQLLPLLAPWLGDRQAGTLASVLAAAVPLVRVIKQASLAVDQAIKEERP